MKKLSASPFQHSPLPNGGLAGVWMALRTGIFKNAGEILAASGTVMTPVANMINGILIVKFLSPESAGMLITAALLPFYVSFLHFGVLTGMSRELPFAEGAGDHERVESILRVTTRISVYTSIAGLLAGLIAALISYWLGKPHLLTLGFFAAGTGAGAGPIVLQTDAGLRGLHRFTRQGLAVVGTNTIGLLGTALIPIWGAYGALCRNMMQDVGSLVLRMRSGVRRWGGGLDLNEVKSLARIGIPFMLSSILAGQMMVVDRAIVAAMMSPREVGELALASLIVNSMTAVPTSLNLILFPKMARDYAQHRSSKKLRRFLVTSLLFNAITILPITAIASIAVGPMVERWFPKYIDGVPAAHIACLTCILWVYLGAGMIMGVLKKMRLYLIVLALAIVLISVLGIIFINQGYGIIGASWARFAGTGIMCIFTIAYAWHLTSIEVNPNGIKAD